MTQIKPQAASASAEMPKPMFRVIARR